MTQQVAEARADTIRSVGWSYSLLIAALWVLGVRLFLTLYFACIAAYLQLPDLRERYLYTGVQFLDSGWEALLLGVWQREDALWYQKIATAGYSANDMTSQLFPLYPMVVRAVWLATGLHPVAAAILVSEVTLIAALFLLHRLVSPRYGLSTANRTLAYLALFPSVFFLHGPFSEGLALLLALLAFFLIDKGRWAEAALIGFLAGLARPQGMLLGIPLAIHLLASQLPPLLARGSSALPADGLAARCNSLFLDLHSRLFPCLGQQWPRLLSLLVTPVLGFATFRWLVDSPWNRPGFQGGSGPMAYQSLGVPGIDLVYAGERRPSGAAYPVDYFDLMLAIGFLLLSVACFRRLEVGWATYSFLFVLAPLSRSSPPFPLMSFPRFVLLLFPAFVLLGLWGERRRVHLGLILLWVLLLLFWAGAFCYGAFVA